MPDPNIVSLQTARNQQGVSLETDPVTGLPRLAGSPRLAVDLDNVSWLIEDEQ